MSETVDIPVPDEVVEQTAYNRGGEVPALREACESIEKSLLARAEQPSASHPLGHADAELIATHDGQLVFSVTSASRFIPDLVTQAARSSRSTEFVCRTALFAHQRYATSKLGIPEGTLSSSSHCLVTRSPSLDQYLEVGFSEQQARVKRLVDAGYSTQEIAGLMNRSEGTIRSHRNRINRKIDRAHRLVDRFGD